MSKNKNNKFKIVTRNSKALTIDTYVIKAEGYDDNILYKEYIDEDYTIVDAYLQTQVGFTIEDPKLLEEIENYINNVECNDWGAKRKDTL